MAHGAVAVLDDVLACAFLGLGVGLGAVDPADHGRPLRLPAVLLDADAVVLAQLALVVLPEPLRDEQRLAVLVRGHRHRRGAAPGDVEVVEQLGVAGRGRGRSVVRPDLVVLRPRYANHSSVSAARSTSRPSLKSSRDWSIGTRWPLYSRMPRPRPMPTFKLPAAQHVVERHEAFGDHDRVVPRQHHHHGAHVDPLRAAGEVGQELGRVVDHRVGREVVLDGPQQVEAERLDQPPEVELLAIDLRVGGSAAGGWLRRLPPPRTGPSRRSSARTARPRPSWRFLHLARLSGLCVTLPSLLLPRKGGGGPKDRRAPRPLSPPRKGGERRAKGARGPSALSFSRAAEEFEPRKTRKSRTDSGRRVDTLFRAFRVFRGQSLRFTAATSPIITDNHR